MVAAEPRWNSPPLAAQYGLEFDLEQVPALIEEHGLVFPMLDGS